MATSGSVRPCPRSPSCATWRALYDGLVRVEAELMLHIHLENNVLFVRALAEESCGCAMR